ncbi:multidrug ABC transporter permease [Sporocytophaga myxococcoides]|uniref:Multidrug ABC transporter permease n=1 Tax=Sporocytophaga myxococcoides TaxID=153721 RepID=A0A098LJA5_9BACT|nr:ABC transporter permease [Sporocytophaga myxococcoides]GAL87030.1 multidrug ABC transporter permease [Sporocytophaga myxococcoides]
MRIFFAIYKELLILIRDKAGLTILFLMPLTMIVIMALIQDGPFRDYQQAEIKVLVLDQDRDECGKAIFQGLSHAGIFKITQAEYSKSDINSVREEVKKGAYKVGVIVPPGTSLMLHTHIGRDISRAFGELSNGQSGEVKDSLFAGIQVFYDPALQASFKKSVQLALDKILDGYQASQSIKVISQHLSQYFPNGNQFNIDTRRFIQLDQKGAVPELEGLSMNSVQHNVPAWTIFGIFFIVIPLAGSIIKEREDGSTLRLRTIPGTSLVIMIGKVLAYLLITLVQFVLMMLAGIFLMPLLGLPALEIGQNLSALTIAVVSIGLAATGLGVFLGTVFKTHQQSSTFAAVFIVILAAIGGIWIPVFIMPEILRKMSVISPLGWGMETFNNLFLRGAGMQDICSEVTALTGFFGAMLIMAYFYNKFKVRS